MAFTAANLQNQNSMAPGRGTYVYVSDTDVQATILASGYFNNVDDNLNLAADDLINVRGDQGSYAIRVDAVSAAGVVTTATVDSANYETVITTKAVESTDSGKTFFLSLAGGFTTTLPVPALGLKYKFIVKTAPTTAYIILTDSVANIIHGAVYSSEAAAVVVAAAADTINFVANLAVVGDWVELDSDGTNWYLRGGCFVQDGITTVQAA